MGTNTGPGSLDWKDQEDHPMVKDETNTGPGSLDWKDQKDHPMVKDDEQEKRAMSHLPLTSFGVTFSLETTLQCFRLVLLLLLCRFSQFKSDMICQLGNLILFQTLQSEPKKK